MRVLLVEDDEDLAFTTSLALKSGGITAVIQPDCDQAVESLVSGSWTPDAVLLDMHLGAGMSSRDFVQWLRANGRADVPVLIVSATSDVAERAREMGAAGYVRKPFDIADLLERVEALAR